MLIRGTDLNASQRSQVLSAFVHRHTHENARQTYGGRCPNCAQRDQYGRGKQTSADVVNGKPWHEYHAPLVTDAEWLAGYAFHFSHNGTRLDGRRMSAEPLSLV